MNKKIDLISFCLQNFKDKKLKKKLLNNRNTFLIGNWCREGENYLTDSKNTNYNKFSTRKLRCFDENMYRNDSLYDLVITLDFNINPVRKFKGSAIFIHCSEKDRKFTEGCIAVNRQDLIYIVKLISPFSFLKIY